ncbi:MAG: thioesterase [Chitinophagaceae bacterium]
MARVKLELPDRFHFSTIIPIRITDLNYGNHVGNDAILSILHEARVRFLTHHHTGELNFGEGGLIMSDVAIEFRNEAFYGDELRVWVAADHFSKAAFDIFYKVERNNEAGDVIAMAKTGMVCFNYEKRKIITVPENIRQKLLS